MKEGDYMDDRFDEKNSHYLNQKNRIFPQSGPDEWQVMDADYNIRTGNTYGTSEEETLEKQGWEGER